MNYLFFDTEGKVNHAKGLKSFGFVLADSDFNVLDRKDIFISITEDGKLKETSNIKAEIPFNQVYDTISNYLTDPNTYVLGFDVVEDVDSVNTACLRNKKAPLKYDFFDVQQLFMDVFNPERVLTLENCVRSLQIEGQFEYHRSEVDAYATMLVMQAICKHLNLSIEQCIEKYDDCKGYADKYKRYLKIDEKVISLETCRVENFKIRVDLPLIEFKKNVGAINEEGKRDGVCYIYDLALNMMFKDRHPHQVAMADKNSLVKRFFWQAQNKGIEKLQRVDAEFANSQEWMRVRRCIVSYEFLGSISQGELKLLFGERYLKTIGRRNKYARMLSERNIEPQNVVKRFYIAQTFLQAMMKNAKWNYGDKNPDIQVENTPKFTDVQQDGDELFVPRAFEYMLSERIGVNQVIACRQEHKQFAKGAQVVDLDALNLSDKNIQLVTKDGDGNVYAFIPCKCSVRCELYNCQYELPLVIRRKLSSGIFD